MFDGRARMGTRRGGKLRADDRTTDTGHPVLWWVMRSRLWLRRARAHLTPIPDLDLPGRVKVSTSAASVTWIPVNTCRWRFSLWCGTVGHLQKRAVRLWSNETYLDHWMVLFVKLGTLTLTVLMEDLGSHTVVSDVDYRCTPVLVVYRFSIHTLSVSVRVISRYSYKQNMGYLV